MLAQRALMRVRQLSTATNSLRLAPRMNGFDGPTVWQEFTPLANHHKAVNLGQGFPDWAPPQFIKDALNQAVDQNLNAYARSPGHLPLCEELAAKYSASLGRKINPVTEVVTTNGSTEALFALTQGMLQEGDEVIAFEPSFDIYSADVKMAGAKLVTVPLRVISGTWTFDSAAFEAAFTPRTRLVIVNSPHNPCGKVFTPLEYEHIASTIKKHPNCVAITDEVYEHLIYDGKQHSYLASLPGMWDRTITMSSAGKTFTITGWKIGWMVGPEHLVKPAALIHQWITFSISTPMQDAVAKALVRAREPYEGHPSYYAWLLAEYTRKRGLLMDGLRAAGIEPIVPQGSFFVMADTRAIEVPPKYFEHASSPFSALPPHVKTPRDWAFCRFLTSEIGVAAIPPSAFMSDETKQGMGNYARFAFCKKDETLQQACEKLLKLKQFQKHK